MASTESRLARNKQRIKDFEAKIASGTHSAEAVSNFRAAIKREQGRVEKRGGQIERQQERREELTAKGKDPKTNKATAIQAAFDKTLKDQTAAAASRTAERQSLEQNQSNISQEQLVGILPTTPAQLEERPSGWSNVWAVLSAAFNPFDKTKIVANTDNRVFNTAAEYVANSPYATAAILMGTVVGVRAGASALSIGQATRTGAFSGASGRVTGAAGRIVGNTAIAKTTASMISKVLAASKKPVFVLSAVGAMIGTYPWSEWALGEAKEGMIFNMKKALATGDPELIAEFTRQSDEIFDINVWEQIARLIPFANIAFSFGEKAQSLQAQKKVNDKISQDEVIKLTTGETDDAKWERVRKEQDEIKHATIDYYNTERKKMVTWENEAKAAATAAKSTSYPSGSSTSRADEIKARNEDARFWAEQAAKQRKLEAEDRKAIADFWTAYRKTQNKLAQDNRPSNLNFGLL